MGFLTAVVMMRGDHLAVLPAVLQQFGYRVKSGPTLLKDWDQVVAALNPPVRHVDGNGNWTAPKAACMANGWTVLLDPELIMATDDEPCVRVSRQLKSRLFALHCDSRTGNYRYGFYDGGLLRAVGYVDGTIEEDTGPRQPEEEDLVDAVEPVDVSEEDLLAVMQRVGVDYLNDLPAANEYYLYELGAAESQRKPWWRFWA